MANNAIAKQVTLRRIEVVIDKNSDEKNKAALVRKERNTQNKWDEKIWIPVLDAFDSEKAKSIDLAERLRIYRDEKLRKVEVDPEYVRWWVSSGMQAAGFLRSEAYPQVLADMIMSYVGEPSDEIEVFYNAIAVLKRDNEENEADLESLKHGRALVPSPCVTIPILLGLGSCLLGMPLGIGAGVGTLTAKCGATGMTVAMTAGGTWAFCKSLIDATMLFDRNIVLEDVCLNISQTAGMMLAAYGVGAAQFGSQNLSAAEGAEIGTTVVAAELATQFGISLAFVAGKAIVHCLSWQ